MNAAATMVPRVFRTPSGNLHLIMSGPRALQLAAILARYDTLLTRTAAEVRRELFEDPAEPDQPALTEGHDYDLDVWHQVMVELTVAEGTTLVRPPLVELGRFDGYVERRLPMGDDQ